MKLEDLYWLAGFAEGEGCFTVWSKHPWEPIFCLNTTDRDVIDKAAAFLRVHVTRQRPRGFSKKMGYQVRLTGATAVGWMFTLYSLLGLRRRSRIRELVVAWKARPMPSNRLKQLWTSHAA